MNQAATAPPSPANKPGSSARFEVVDWVRGAAVVLMIQTHLYDAWASPAAKLTAAYGWTRFVGGIPSRLFLMLVGVSMALRFESQLGKGVAERRALVRPVQRRGIEVLGLAYLFRLQEYILGHLGQAIRDLPYYWRDLLRVDILNCIGASMVIVPIIAAPRRGRPAYLLAFVGLLVAVALGPVLGPAHYPAIVPTWISSYFGGQRPMSWFPLFPWAGWPLAGVIVGHLWVRGLRGPGGARRVFVATGLAGLALIGIVDLIRRIDPHVIQYPSDLVQQLGPGSFFYRLGMNCVLAFIGWIAVEAVGNRFSIFRQLGRTSLLVYWIHVDLCYGLLAHKLGIYGQLSMLQATVGLALMIALMLGVSLAKTRWTK